MARSELSGETGRRRIDWNGFEVLTMEQKVHVIIAECLIPSEPGAQAPRSR
jgi:hypothetical protein